MPEDYKISLNPIQYKAIDHHISSPLKVIAGAGTGKTLVLTHRFVNILKKYKDIKPYNILALTFTNKAALEMKERIIGLAKNERIDILNYPLWIGTFHSFCGRVLRENAFAAGLDPNFVILTEADIKQIHHHLVEDFLNLRLNTDQFKPEECNYVVFHNTNFLYSHMIDFISKLKDSLISPEDFRNLANTGMKKFQVRLNSFLEEALKTEDISSQTKRALKERRSESIPIDHGYEAEMIDIIYYIYRAFQDYLDRNNMMDFSDLIFKTYYLLDKNKDLRQRYKQQFKYILVDEFQDTNEAQFKLLCLLACNERLTNVTIVGDDKQSIYGWRNARVENVDDFDTDAWDGLSLNVSLNYRSYGEILDFAHYAIIQEEKFQRKSEEIRLEPAGLGMANKPVVVMYEADSREQEATFIAHEIIQLLKSGIEPGDIIILMRSVKSVKPYEDVLRKFQIPYRTTGGTGFYDRQEIKDILAYLMVIDDPFNTSALVRVLKQPPVGLNDMSLYLLRHHNNYNLQLFDALNNVEEILKDPVAIGRVKKVLELLENMWNVLSTNGGMFYIISQLLEKSGYLKYIHSKPSESRKRELANIKKLLFMAREFDQKSPFNDLRDFIQYVQFSIDQTVMEPEADMELDKKAVQIMTIHQAKGLEFNIVFIANLISKSFPTDPNPPAYLFDREDGLIINDENSVSKEKFFKFRPYDLREHNYLYTEHGITNYYEKFKNEHFSEERRLLYVAITRAKHLLYLSRPKPLSDRRSGVDFFRELLEGFAGNEKICKFRSFSKEDGILNFELPLWLTREKSAFENLEEAESLGKKLLYLRDF